MSALQDLIIPAGYELVCDKGTNIILGKGKNILSYSPYLLKALRLSQL